MHRNIDMKSFILLALSVVLTMNSAFCQGEIEVIGSKDQMQTLFGYNSKITGYGAMDTRFSLINGKESVIVGGHGGVIFNSYFYLGLGAYGLATTQNIATDPLDVPLDMQMGYTGLMLGMNVLPKKVVHFSIPLFVGVGNLVMEKNDARLETSPFIIIEPGLQLEVNLVRFMKVGLGGGYRMVRGSSLNYDISDADLTSWSGNFSLIFGKFK
ncbi:MAG: hypothetical protein U5K79_17145 [Cyclobacteriaceae bacterium]|nr:hypothetical protein [Cyclobacteriaceae bacterium]